MLKYLDIKNYQSHKHTHLDFHPNVNAIVGVTDSGKSAIMRSLCTLIENKPAMDNVRGWYCKNNDDVSIELGTVEDNIITRIKGKENEYRLNTFTKPFRGMKRGEVPEDIKRILNISDISIQKQDDSFFLFNKTSGDVAKYLNQIVNLDVIDISHANIDSRKREIKSNIKYETNSLDNKREDLKKYENISEIEEQVNILEKLESEIELNKETVEKITASIQEYQNISEKIKRFADLEKKKIEVEELIQLQIEISRDKDRLTTIIGLLATATKLALSLNKISKIEGGYDEVNQLLELSSNLFSKINTCAELGRQLHIIQQLQIQIELKNKEIEKLEKSLEDIMPEICPLCNQRIKK